MNGTKKGKGPSATEGNIVPPISVLIVDGASVAACLSLHTKGALVSLTDFFSLCLCLACTAADNPINQTILSTFMRRKKIKYDVAKNGEEAVQKWRSGVFHLILVSGRVSVCARVCVSFPFPRR